MSKLLLSLAPVNEKEFLALSIVALGETIKLPTGMNDSLSFSSFVVVIESFDLGRGDSNMSRFLLTNSTVYCFPYTRNRVMCSLDFVVNWMKQSVRN